MVSSETHECMHIHIHRMLLLIEEAFGEYSCIFTKSTRIKIFFVSKRSRLFCLSTVKGFRWIIFLWRMSHFRLGAAKSYCQLFYWYAFRELIIFAESLELFDEGLNESCHHNMGHIFLYFSLDVNKQSYDRTKLHQ